MADEVSKDEAVAERAPMTEAETPKKSGFFNNLSIRNKLVALLTVFGLSPAIVLFVIL
ncbi:MAG: hypothetical protein HOK25_01630 [Rhodospirillaceae bacterium]|nr:hypothetical protein [Rhodospirillaceae bacterium]